MSDDSRDDGEPVPSALREAMAAGLRGDDVPIPGAGAEALHAQHMVLLASEAIDGYARRETPAPESRPPVAQMLDDVARYVEAKRRDIEVSHRLTHADLVALEAMWRATQAPVGLGISDVVAGILETAAEIARVSDPVAAFHVLMAARFPDHCVERSAEIDGEVRFHIEGWARRPGAPGKVAGRLPGAEDTEDWLKRRWRLGVTGLARARAKLRQRKR